MASQHPSSYSEPLAEPLWGCGSAVEAESMSLNLQSAQYEPSDFSFYDQGPEPHDPVAIEQDIMRMRLGLVSHHLM